MFAVPDRALIREIVEAFAATQTKPSKTLADALDRAARLATAAQSLGGDPGALGVAVTAALDDGRDPAADPGVQRALAAIALAGNNHLSDQVTGAAVERVRGICQQEADNNIAGWSKAVDRAAEALIAAHGRLGSVALDDAATIVALGGDAAAVWAQAQAAVSTIDAAVAGWSAVASFTRLATANPRRRVLVLADVCYATWCNLERHNHGPWDALLAGLPLSLPSFAEYRARVRVIEHGEQEPETVIDRGRSHIAGREIRVDNTGKEVNAA